MANAFGFEALGQELAPDPRQVGQQLMQSRQVQQQQQPQVAQPLAIDADPEEAAQAATEMRSKDLRKEGGKLMGGGGSDIDPAMSQAVGDALTRAGGGHKGNPDPNKQRDARVLQLQQLGISELEANLLREVL